MTTMNLALADRDEWGGVLGWFDRARTERLAAIGRGVLRYGLVALLFVWGGFKFTEMEAEAIRLLVGNHPLMSWMVPVLGIRGASSLIGVIELAAAALIGLRPLRPRLSAIGSLVAAGIILVTLSFLFSMPGAFA